MNTDKVGQDPVTIAERYINHTNQHVFLTGKAGTGKTTFLKNIITKTHKKVLVTAPTGIAALNAGGVTIHSQFQLPFGGFIPDKKDFFANDRIKFETQTSIIRHLKMNETKRKAIREAELLIIDEVSMLRADTLDAIDYMLKYIRKNNSSFGGLQVLFIGDLLQLPPVIKEEEWNVLREYYNSPFFFEAIVLKENPPVFIELTTIYRQQDQTFTNILNNIRYNNITNQDALELNKYYKPGLKPKADEGYITLTTHNRIADTINQDELKKLAGKETLYEAEIHDEFPDNLFPCERNLILKEGAQVMFIKNDISGNQDFYNGKIGVIEELKKDQIVVRIDNQKKVYVKPYEWENKRYKLDETSNEITEESLGSFIQYPLRLAWAITIHKSQGLTFEKAIIDVKNVFSSGQTYVALSRLKSLDGLILTSPFNSTGISNNKDVILFEQQKETANPAEYLSGASWEYFKSFSEQAFNFKEIISEWKTHLYSYNKSEEKSEKQNHFEWAQQQMELLQPLYESASKFSLFLKVFIETNDLEKLDQRLRDAWNYYKEKLKEICSNIILHQKKMELLKKTKSYVNELEQLESQVFSKMQHISKTILLLESIINESLLLKDKWENSTDLSWRKDLFNVKVDTPAKKTKKEKGETFRVTYQLYQEGKTIAEIAKERSLTEGTIHGHFAKLIDQDLIKISDVMTEERIKKISESLDTQKEPSQARTKEILGADFSYGEIQMVMAHKKSRK